MHHGPAFTGLTAAHAADSTVSTVLAEVALPGSIRSQQSAYGDSPRPAGCLFPVRWGPPRRPGQYGGLLLPLGVRRLRAYAPARNARYCHTTVTNADAAGVEADLDVLDEHGMVLLAVRGLQLGTGVSEHASRDRVLSERLLTIEWQQRELPEADRADAGTWLLISTSAAADMVATDVDRRVKAPRRAMHGHVLAAACRPRGQCRAAARSARCRRVYRCGRAHGPRTATPDDAARRSVAVSASGIWCASPASCPKSRANRRGCMS